MKYFYIVLLSVLLVSCGAEVQKENNAVSETNTIEDKTINEIDAELANIDIPAIVIPEVVETEMNNKIAPKVEKINTVYSNPQQEVAMEISFSLDDDKNISKIQVSSSNWDLSKFNDAVQVLVGTDIEDASDANFAGASLTTAAFQEAIKNY